METNIQGLKNLTIIIICLLLLKQILQIYKDNSVYLPTLYITKKDTIHSFYTILLAFVFSTFNYVTIKHQKYFLFFSYVLYAIINYRISQQMPSLNFRIWNCVYFVECILKNISFYVENTPCKLTYFYSFLILPTMCFSVEYKRKRYFNYKEILYRATSTLGFGYLFLFIRDNYLIVNLHKLMNTKNIDFIIQYISYAISVVTCWICLFLFYFYGFKMLILEIMRIDDRLYYDWWNSRSSYEFWRKWNLPFHDFTKKYIFDRTKKYGLWKSRLLCFFFSAVLHEYGMFIGTGRLGGPMFVGMLGQALIHVKFGNIMFWIWFCLIGQPLLLYLYFRLLYLEQ